MFNQKIKSMFQKFSILFITTLLCFFVSCGKGNNNKNESNNNDDSSIEGQEDQPSKTPSGPVTNDNKDKEIVDKLKKEGFLKSDDVNEIEEDYPVLSILIIKKKTDLVKELLDHSKIDVNKKGHIKKGVNFTPLYLAFSNNDFKSVEYLIDKNADFTIEDPLDKNSALNLAVIKGKFDLIKKMYNKNPDKFKKIINNKNVEGYTPLNLAQSKEISDFLIEKGAKRSNEI